MNPLRILIILFFLTAIIACSSPQQDIRGNEFIISANSIKADTIINSAVYFAGYILCLQEDNKLFVLDTSFNFNDSLTSKFSKFKFNSLRSYNDTLLLFNNDTYFYLDSGFILKEYKPQNFKYGIPLYNDSTYDVYGCSLGEFGGSVFFREKLTNKYYSYPATAVQQVLKYKGNYIVSSFLAHMTGFSDYLSINDPTKLYELKDEKQKNYCNWWIEIDSIREKRRFETKTPPGVNYYADSISKRTLTIFPHSDTLYSIYSTDSVTILAKHENFKLTTIDTLLKKRIHFHEAKTNMTNNVAVTVYRESWSTSDSNNNFINHLNTGLIFIRDNRITFLEFKKP